MNKHPMSGYITPIHIKGIPVLVHWSFPAGGLFVAIILGDWSLITVLSLIAAYTTLILIHEFGHAIAARSYSLKVHAILITAAGGWCYADTPKSVTSSLIFYGGGLIAQLILFVASITLLSINDSPTSVILSCFILVFTFVNVVIFAINIYPFEYTDGKRIWNILASREQQA